MLCLGIRPKLFLTTRYFKVLENGFVKPLLGYILTETLESLEERAGARLELAISRL